MLMQLTPFRETVGFLVVDFDFESGLRKLPVSCVSLIQGSKAITSSPLLKTE